MYSYIENALNDGLSTAKINDAKDKIIMYQAALLELKDIIIAQTVLATASHKLTRKEENIWRNYLDQQSNLFVTKIRSS